MKSLQKLLGVNNAELGAEGLLKLRANAELELRRRQNVARNESTEDIYKMTRNSILEFTKFTYPEYQANWHHILVCRYLDLFARGEIKRLMINMPPQHGKSELASRRLPAYLFGINPDERIISCSHTADFSSQINREVQRIIDNDSYYRLFPDTTLNRSNVKSNSFGKYIRTSDQFEIVGHKGYYKSAGVGGDITGRTATTLILDDPYKNHEEAWSKTIRDKVWFWYWSTFYARRTSDDVKILIIHTRWHEDDLSGKLLSTAGGDGWTVLSLPAICEIDKHEEDPRSTGDVLWPDRFSLDEMLKTKIQFGSYLFSALYQQNPQPAEGGLFKRKDFRYFIRRDDEYQLADGTNKYVYQVKDCQLYMTMDLALTLKETSDYTVVLTFAITPKKEILILDIYRDRIEGADHLNLLKEKYFLWKPILIGIEDNQYQKTLVQHALREGLPVKGIRSVQDKKAKALPIAAKIEANKVFFKHEAPWLDLFENELLGFPHSAHDDQVDALAFISNILMMGAVAPLQTTKINTSSRFSQQKNIKGF